MSISAMAMGGAGVCFWPPPGAHHLEGDQIGTSGETEDVNLIEALVHSSAPSDQSPQPESPTG